MNFEPVTLQGDYVRLEPLSLEHLDGLCEFGLDPELWRWTTTRLTPRLSGRATTASCGKLSMRDLLIPVRYKRSLGAVSLPTELL